jgi:hypothetical protein
MSQVIRMDSISRSAVKGCNDASIIGFTKALGLIYTLNTMRPIDARATVERMAMDGTLSEGEKAGVYQYFSWGRG